MSIKRFDKQFTSDPRNGRVIYTIFGDTITKYSYPSLGELSSMNNSVNGNSIYSTNYTRDSLGRITTHTETIEGVTTTKRYTYDIAGRLSEVYDNNSLIAKYYYDANGNRDSVVTPNGTTSGIYDVQDRMLQYGNANYVYTRNGELNLKIEETDTTKYVYDDFGNLMSVTLPSGDKIEYIIDGLNRRIGRKFNGVVTNRWIYAGPLHPAAEVDSVGNIIASYHGSYMKRGDTLYSIVRDHLGSVRVIINSETGDVVQRIDYDEFGNIISDSNPSFQPFGYAGGIYDSQTKLVRFGARDYDAVSGRWISKDPIGFKGGVSNFYEYCVNDPINLVDLNGKQVMIEIDIIAGRPFYFRLAPNQQYIPEELPDMTEPEYQPPIQQFEPPPELTKTPQGDLLDKLGTLWDQLHDFLFGSNPCDSKKNSKPKYHYIEA